MRFAKQLPIGRTDFRFEVETTRNKKKADTQSNRKLYLSVRAIGVLSLLMLGAIVWIQVTRDFKPRAIADVANSPHHLSVPVLAIEFIETPEQLKTILGTENPEHNRKELLDDIQHDYYFIVAYALVYIALSLLLAHRHQRRWAVYLAWMGAICGIGAALFDVKENMAIVNLLNAQTPDQQTVNAIHFAATVKWTLSFITAAILAVNFYASDGWLLLVGMLLRLTAVLGLAGLLYIPILPWALVPMLPVLILLTIRALFQPLKFIDEL